VLVVLVDLAPINIENNHIHFLRHKCAMAKTVGFPLLAIWNHARAGLWHDASDDVAPSTANIATLRCVFIDALARLV